jgi:hypothetical protein
MVEAQEGTKVDTRPLRHPAPDNFDGWAFYGI